VIRAGGSWAGTPAVSWSLICQAIHRTTLRIVIMPAVYPANLLQNPLSMTADGDAATNT
jgi:hypothetical protein